MTLTPFHAIKIDHNPGLSTPVLLQQILRAMEGPGPSHHKAAMFAVLRVLLRLVSVQSGVLNLWYSRRCYERSRGEMITMIFEKTLGRKIIGAPKKPESTETNDGDTSALGGPAKQSAIQTRAWFRWLYKQIRRPFRSDQPVNEPKEPASMGKILNLMRYVIYIDRIPASILIF